MIRLPDGMRDQLSELARLNGRSVNAEVVSRLERSLRGDNEIENTYDVVQKLTAVDHEMQALKANFVNLLRAINEEDPVVFANVLRNEIERIKTEKK